MEEPQTPYEPVSTQDKLTSYLQWPTNRPFYYEWGSVNKYNMVKLKMKDNKRNVIKKKEKMKKKMMRRRLVKVMTRVVLHFL